MKNHLTILIFLFFSFQAKAQEWLLNFDAGYGFNIATESILFGSSFSLEDYEQEFNSLIYTYGRGLNFNTEIEYVTPKKIGFGLGIAYLKSKEFEMVDRRLDVVFTEFWSARMFRFFPYLKLRHAFDSFSIYTKFGYLLGVGGRIENNWTYSPENDTESALKTIRSKGFSHGGTAGLGIEFRINDHLNWSTEIKLMIQSYGPKRGRVVERFRDGKNTLEETDIWLNETNYVKNYIEGVGPNREIDYSKPRTQLRKQYPFSSVGINIGVQYRLTIKEE